MTRTASGATVLTRRVLNRTTLRRQALLEQSAMPTLEMVGHLVVGQAQNPTRLTLATYSSRRRAPHWFTRFIASIQQGRRVVLGRSVT